MEWSTSTIGLAALVPLVITVEILRRFLLDHTESKRFRLPPGPTRLPILGSVLSIDSESPWLTYTQWREKYGDIMHVRLLDSDIIVLNSLSIAKDLLEKRSHIYSDRPYIATVNPFGHDCNFAFSRYGDHWRLCRRIFHQTFRAEAALSFRPMQLYQARQLVASMNDSPDEYPFHFSTFSAAVTLKAVYDYEPSPRNDPLVSIVENYIQTSLPSLTPEKAALIKIFPILLHIPDWFPGSWIKRAAREAYAWRNKMVETPYEYVQKRMESKEHNRSAMVSDHITRMEEFDEPYRSDYELALKHASTTAFLGAAETTSSTLITFTLAMVQNPHVWKRAQAEIDAIVGTGRLPEFDDRPNLTYIDAIMRETLRWGPPVPLCVPHAVTTSDVYEDYFIPKGATIIGNSWAMSRDETRYPDAEKFIPERFLDVNGLLTNDNPAEYIFGFGRRMCPGRHTADSSVWIAIATMLATLEFHLAKDAQGNDVAFTATFAGGITRHPNTFPCRLILRSHVTRQVLEQVLDK